MIITRTPFRISFCGGGSDLPSYYHKYGGCVISTSINKYMYIVAHKSFFPHQTVLKYSQTEIVENLDDIKHVIFRECLKQEKVDGIEIASIADVPQGTGLGSSSSFTVGLLNALKCYKREYATKHELAESACNMEINVCGSPIGKQDQYAAAYGGLNFYRFNQDDSVSVEPVLIPNNKYEALERNLIMLYVGGEHDASAILREQGKNIVDEKEKEEGQKKIVSLTHDLKEQLERGNIDILGKILDENWKIKRTLASGISNSKFDELYDLAMRNGALGGKILGAGGSGFFLFYVPEDKQNKFREAMKDLPEMQFRFDHQGTIPISIS
ncbi:GHMP kinase [Candidatus Saccharibacteria bacterium]|nr:GHMP kinase [Candidatus Saccharibacteria bacterium]